MNDDASFSAYLLSIQQSLIFYCTIFVLMPGLFLNMGTMYVFTRKKFARNPMALYNVYIAFTGIICILIFFACFSPFAYNLNIAGYSVASCKTLAYITHVFTQMISWLHVLLSLDRMVSVLSPATHLSVKTPKFITLSSIVLFMGLIAENVEYFWYDLYAVPNMPTLKQCTSDFFTKEASDMINVLMHAMLPLIFTLVANCVLIVSLFKQKRSFNLNRPMRREIAFSASVLSQNILFMVFIAPQAAFVMYQYVIDYVTDQQSALSSSTRSEAILSLAITSSNVFATYTVSSSFPINLVFNKLFRQELLFIARSMLAKVSPKYAVNYPSQIKTLA